jgi:hypothetical protein
MKRVTRTFKLDEDSAALLLQLAGSPRKQGTYLSELIHRAAQEQTVEARIRALEAELARLKAEVTPGSVHPREAADG